jgi:predicted metalloprotease with PDZ domain
MAFVEYHVSLEQANANLFNVTCKISDPKERTLNLSLPAWIPGSYLIRDFAKNIVHINATENSIDVPLTKIDKDSWSIKTTKNPIEVNYQIYARDQSVRAAYLDQYRGFFNGTSLFLKVKELENDNHDVIINKPKWLSRSNDWRVATAMQAKRIKADGFGTYTSPSYDSLIEHPFEIGDFKKTTFKVKNVPHEIVVTGLDNVDLERLRRDIKKIVETQSDFWEDLPIDRYTFLVNAVTDGYGGLEHTHSTALICSTKDLPTKMTPRSEYADDYVTFLGLCSHEYFHLWNVKRLKPKALSPYDLSKENYTELLWAFEGITSYYDDLFLVRAGLITKERYFSLLAKTVTTVERNKGRKKQTLSESSFYAWTKFYKQDENAINAISSYYTKGSLAALCLDLTIRKQTKNKKSLDDVMRDLWEKYGATGVGVPENGVEKIAAQIAGANLNKFFNNAIRSTNELPLKALLKTVHLNLVFRRSKNADDRGGYESDSPIKSSEKRHDIGIICKSTGQGMVVKQVIEGGAAQCAGINPADIVIAIDGSKVNGNNYQRLIDSVRAGTKTLIHFFRNGRLRETMIEIKEATLDTACLIPTNKKNQKTWPLL